MYNYTLNIIEIIIYTHAFCLVYYSVVVILLHAHCTSSDRLTTFLGEGACEFCIHVMCSCMNSLVLGVIKFSIR